MDKEAANMRFLKTIAKRRKLISSVVPKVKHHYTSKPLPKSFVQGLGKGIDPHRAWAGYRHQAMQGNDDSLLLWPFRAAAEKIIGGKKGIRKVRGGAWKHLGSKALVADTHVGKHIQNKLTQAEKLIHKVPLVGKHLDKIPQVAKDLFTMKEDIPWGKGLKKEVYRSSALAPLAKARDLAEPILVGVGLEKGIKALSGKKQPGPDMNDQHLREKVASVMLHLHERNKEHEKRAQALKLLYKKAEMGYEQLPQTHSELETKLAALVNEDLVVLEKALELAGGNIKLGELEKELSRPELNTAQKFQASILGDEL